MIPTVNNLEQLRKALNALMEDPQKLAAGYGAGLPAAVNEPEGRYFVNTTEQKLYQVQSGAWVLVETNLKSLAQGSVPNGQTVSDAGVVPYSTEEFDLRSEYDTSTKAFTATDAGYYRIHANLYILLLAAGKYVAISIDVNGARRALGQQDFNESGAGRQASSQATRILHLAAGDVVKITLATDAGVALTIIDGPYNWFEIEQI